ncbi:hypothetical protein ACHWWK_26810 [Klebsiella pneumoniae]
MLNDRTNLHYSRLADHLNNANLAMSDFVQRSAANFTVQGSRRMPRRRRR